MAQQRRRISIRTRTAVALGVVAVALPVGGAFAVASATRDAMADRALDGELTTARAVATHAERSTRFAVDLLRQAAERPGLQGWVATDDRAGQRSVLDNLFGSGLYQSVATYGPDRSVRVAIPRRPDIDEGTEGSLDSFVSPPRHVGGDSVIVVREPVVVDGELVGYVAGEVSLTETVSEASLRFGETGALSLVDRDGDIFVSGDPARRQRRLLTPTLRQLAASNEEGTGRYYSVLLARDEVGAYAPVPGTTWGILATQAASEVFADIEAVERALVAGAFVVVMLGLGITFLMWRNVTAYETRLDADQRALEAAARDLERTNMEVESANRSLREFVAVAAHDLRGPLTSISGFAELLNLHEGRIGADQRAEYVTTILRQSDAMRAIVDDLQTISQIEAGHMPVEAERVSACALVRQVVDSFLDAGSEVAITCREGIDVYADRNHVERILRNFVSNALKYGDSPIGVEVDLRGEFVELRVVDRGPGVPQEFVPHLFEKFARADDTRSSQPGTGLGLSIVAGLARLNGGDAWYEQCQPQGSCFGLRLPAAEQPVESSASDDVGAERSTV
ncbi:MAG TPA: sensor histidine kinase [Acidimicrobiia bacterium]|nr:sensor histidine kinase [Acidimicrobiia bacterium]